MFLLSDVIANLVSFFLASAALQFAISVTCVLLITGRTAYDTQRIKEIYVAGEVDAIAGKKAIMRALTPYLDYLNLLLNLLQLSGNRGR